MLLLVQPLSPSAPEPGEYSFSTHNNSSTNIIKLHSIILKISHGIILYSIVNTETHIVLRDQTSSTLTACVLTVKNTSSILTACALTVRNKSSVCYYR